MASEEELQLQLSKLSSDELMVKLINYGVSVGPITGTTRPLFEKKLLRLLGVDQQANIESKGEHREEAFNTCIMKYIHFSPSQVLDMVPADLEFPEKI